MNHLPELFIEQLRDLLPGEWDSLVKTITTTGPSVAVRVNAARGVGMPRSEACTLV